MAKIILTAEDLTQEAWDYLRTSGRNRIKEAVALRPDLIGLELYDRPVLGFARADDPMFQELRQPEAVHPEFKLPREWLEHGETVISFFFPFTETIRRANSRSMDWPADEWLHGRIEGQELLNSYARHLCQLLQAAGWEAAAPSLDPHFQMLERFASNWSERHVAYICGLGTFGMSRGLITEKGMAGRFGSVVTSCPFPATRRPYTGLTEYCIACGKCAKNCPVGAIAPQRGVLNAKDQTRCAQFVSSTRQPSRSPEGKVRYGCGKCQVNVPCAAGIPMRAPLSRYQP